jgi:hypothetical protein
MKRTLSAILAALLMFGSAGAASMNEYTLSPFAFNEEAMLSLTFGDRVADAQLNDREYPFFDLPDSSGAPFCGLDDTYGFGQMRFMIFTALSASESHEPHIYDNIESSGVAKCALTPEQARAEAEGWLSELGVSDFYLQSVTAYGRFAKLPGGYMVAFGQQIGGLPVYWAASMYDGEMGLSSGSNRLEVVVGDSGLVSIYGFWSAFTTTKQNIPVISEEAAVAAFQSMDVNADSAELCYLLTGTRGEGKAFPAYRFQNRFIGAADGKALQ